MEGGWSPRGSPFDSGPLRGPTLRANGFARPLAERRAAAEPNDTANALPSPLVLSVAARSAAESKGER